MGYVTDGELAGELQLKKKVCQTIAEILVSWQDLPIELTTGKLLILFYGIVWKKLAFGVRQKKPRALLSLTGT